MWRSRAPSATTRSFTTGNGARHTSERACSSPTAQVASSSVPGAIIVPSQELAHGSSTAPTSLLPTNEREVVGCEHVVARCHTPTLLDLVEEPLDQVAALARRQTLKRLQAIWNDMEGLFVDSIDRHLRCAK